MTYSIGGKIQAADFNEAINGGAVIPVPVGVNHLWNDGTVGGTAPGRQYGYGQTPALSTVAAGAKITAGPGGTPTEWQKMFSTMNTIATHQGTTLTWAARHSTFPPTTGTKIAWETNLASSIASLSTNRFNAALQGGTATSVATSADTWNDKLTVTFTAAFANDLAARSFFNAGGQLGITSSHPAGTGTTINTLISDLCSDSGTVWLSAPTTGTISLAGTTYSGVTKTGGSNPAGATVNTNYGFYALTSTSTEIFKQFSDTVFGTYGTGTFMNISASYNGTGTITFVVVYDEVPSAIFVSTGTTSTLTVRSPSTSQLTNTWGTPTLTNSYVVNSVGILADFLIVAGGGAGGAGAPDEHGGGGGGAGGHLVNTGKIITPASYAVVVGAGGTGASNSAGTPGANSTFNSLTAIGGGRGGNAGGGVLTGGSGGGGGAYVSQAGGIGTAGQGYNGGNAGYNAAGGGGGAGGVGGASSSAGGNGGIGAAWVDGVTRAGGGGGGVGTKVGGFSGGTGGTGGGGAGAGVTVPGPTVQTPTAGTVNTGSGGGGGAAYFTTATAGAAGGSGVVVIRYAGTVATATGGTITISGGYVYHTFTSSGTFIVP